MAKNVMQNIWEKYKVWIIIVAAIILFIISPYNGLVARQETVVENWANIETDYQRRFDLIPNLVETVKGFAAQEADVFKSITASRSAWQGATNRTDKVAAANQLDTSLSRLLLTVESYPTLKSDQNFLALQTELAGTENRIAVSRKRYNEVVKIYNAYRRKFPKNIIASVFGFGAETSFTVQDEEAKDAVKVQF